MGSQEMKVIYANFNYCPHENSPVKFSKLRNAA